MERRIVLAGLAALAATPALAQNPPADAPAMKVAPPAGGLSEAVQKHMKDTTAVGSLSLMTSRIALGKVKHPTVKQFAEFETAEQDTIADILKGKMTSDMKPMGDVKAPTDAEVMGNLDAKGKETVEKMKAMKAGPDFEKAYVKAQVEGHRELLTIQETYLKVADDADETNVAKLAKGMIKEHLTLLADLEKRLG